MNSEFQSQVIERFRESEAKLAGENEKLQKQVHSLLSARIPNASLLGHFAGCNHMR
jgi:hypothetical protein